MVSYSVGALYDRAILLIPEKRAVIDRAYRGSYAGRVYHWCVKKFVGLRTVCLPNGLFIVMGETDQDETPLVMLVQRGDIAAFEKLLRRLHAPMRQYVTRMVGPADADDCYRKVIIFVGLIAAVCTSKILLRINKNTKDILQAISARR